MMNSDTYVQRTYNPTKLTENRHKANRLACTLRGITRPTMFGGHELIKGVELFGSRARGIERVTSDYDLILLTDTLFAQSLNQHLTRALGVAGLLDGYHDEAKEVRRREIFEYFDISEKSIEMWSGISACKIDVFCFPVEWRSMLSTLQYALPHADKDFMQNIAKDAIPFTFLNGFRFPKHKRAAF